MRLNYLAYTCSLAIMYFSLMMLIPVIPALYYAEYNTLFAFILPAFSAFIASFLLKRFVSKRSDIKSINDIKKSEGLCAVIFSWVFAGLFASIPYLFFDINFVNAFFEATSGITATGATILTHFDYPKTLFFWRSFTQWLGGMGIIVLFIAILPQFAIAGRQLFFAEAPGPTEDKFTPRIKNTAKSLWKVYFGMTVLLFILLKLNGMSGYNSLLHSFSTVSGGGFSPEPASFSGMSIPVMYIMCFFMFFAGASYNLQYSVWTKLNPFLLFKNEEFKAYLYTFLAISLILASSLFVHMDYSFSKSAVHSLFQVSSVMSTSGFCSADFANWDYMSKAVLFIAMLAGSCASSAGGGIKIVRWLLIFKIMKTEMAKILHPKAIFNIKIGKYSVSEDVLYQTLMFVFFYAGIVIISTVLVSVTEKNTILGISGTISSIGNIGPGLGKIIGPLGNFDSLKDFSKIILTLDMYAGRLELIPFLVLFQKDLWRLK